MLWGRLNHSDPHERKSIDQGLECELHNVRDGAGNQWLELSFRSRHTIASESDCSLEDKEDADGNTWLQMTLRPREIEKVELPEGDFTLTLVLQPIDGP